MLIQKILFSQASGLIKLGAKKIIQPEDKLKVPDDLSVYSSNWNESLLDWSSGRALYFSLFRVYRRILTRAIIFQILGSVFAFCTPLLIHNFVTRLQQGNWSQDNMIVLFSLAAGFGVCGAMNGITIQHYFYQTLKFFQTSTSVINKKIFNHALRLSNHGKQTYQIGDIVNFMSSDADAMGDAAITTIDLTNAAVLLVGCSTLLFYYIGWSAFIALVVMAVLIPLTQKLAKKFVHLEEEMMSQRDARMTLMTQILNSIRVVKYFSWEKSVHQEVEAIRTKEIQSRKKLAKSEILWGLMYSSISTVVLFVALLTHYYRGEKIDLPLVLTCVSIFSLMEDQFGGLSRFISRFMNIFVSGNRITTFLKSATVPDVVVIENTKNLSSGLKIRNLNFKYNNQEKLLTHLNLVVKPSESLAIIGPVGSGKSTLLQLCLSEIADYEGEIELSQHLKKAYVPQEAFIVNSSLEENIVFGEIYDHERLQKSVHLACLDSDVNLLPSGLQTEIGEKGVNLSGGQKQRVSLARAVYSSPDIIFLDDPLSAVDPATENWLCDKLIFGEWSNKTRIVSTHRIAHLDRFDQILFLTESGYQVGRFEELKNNSKEFKVFLEIENKNKTHEIEILQKNNLSDSAIIQSAQETRVTVDEDRAVGSVEASVYWSYIRTLGGDSRYRNLFIFVLFTGAMLHVCTPMLQRGWLTQKSGQVSPEWLVIGYGLVGLLTLIISALNTFWWTHRGVTAGKLFHDRMLNSVLKSKIRFFDSTPIGRILQRFSRDVESVDVHLQWSFDSAIHSLFNVISSFLLIIIALPISLVVLIPTLVIYYFIQNRYRRVAREVKRLDSLARSPRYAHFKETLQGLNVIRAFNNEKWFNQQFLKKLEHSVEMYYTHYMVNRWFSSRLPLIGALISLTTATGVVIATSKGWLTTGMAGLVTLYALECWRHLNWGVRIFSDLESRMTSVERLEYYTQLPAEVDYVQDHEFRKKYPTWPQSGSLEFKHVYLRYADHLPDVLKDVCFKIESGHRAGIVGRTGSGKSTLFQAVYRFVDTHSGEILIDGVPVTEIPLERLRKELAVIPQDPSLFLGSLRSNLDRYSEKSDQEIWDILDKVGLKLFVSELPQQLNYHVTENGANLSQGQRQLICLARALLVNVKIIFLDEATASVDLETDDLIQTVIRSSLSGITLVTIAHRISTLKDYDQIIELQNGTILRN